MLSNAICRMDAIRDDSTCEKGSKRRSTAVGSTPGPVSRTIHSALSAVARTVTATEPRSVNLIAFPITLMRICHTRVGSATILTGVRKCGEKRTRSSEREQHNFTNTKDEVWHERCGTGVILGDSLSKEKEHDVDCGELCAVEGELLVA